MTRATPLALIVVLALMTPVVAQGAEEQEPAKQESPERWTGVFGSLKLGFSAWRGALEIDAQAGWAFRKVTVGVVLEHNPFIDLSRPSIDAGAFGFGAFVGLRVPLTQKLGLRFEALVGGSVLLFDMFGYDKGDVGLWLGARVMGLDIELHEHVALTVDVVDIVLPAYHLDTMPLIYPQWRWSVGVVFH